MAASVPAVRLRSVSKTYDLQRPALRGLSLDIAAGEWTTVLGPSGSGKTTLLMLLAGFAAPDSGTIELAGQPPGAASPERRGIGVVLQGPTLFPQQTVAENVAFPLRLRGGTRPGRRRLVADALALVRLQAVAGQLPASLSRGERRLVALARALVSEPALLLLDEPLGGLDRDWREALQAALRDRQQRLGTTIVLVTHDHDEALGLSDRVAVLRDGRLEQVDAPAALYEHPANAFVAGFVGANNLLPGRLETIEDDLARIRLDAGQLVEAAAAEAMAPGADCVVAIRPQRIAIASATAAELGEHALAVRVLERRYGGDHVRLRVALLPAAGRAPITLTVQRPTAAAGVGLTAGREAAIAWQPEHASAFRADPAAALTPG